MIDWREKFRKDIIQGTCGLYDSGTRLLLEELFFMMESYVDDDTTYNAYFLVIMDFLVPTHYETFRKIASDMAKEFEE